MSVKSPAAPAASRELSPIPTSQVLGLSLSRLSYAETLERIEQMAETKLAAFFITAPLNYAMECHRNPQLEEVNRKATFIVADGMPLVWVAKAKGKPLAERVAGSDLVPSMCAMAARRGESVFLLGAAPGVAAKAAEKLVVTYPGLRIAGTACPSMSTMSASEEAALIETIRDSGAAFLFFARGQPAGEIWLADHFEKLGCISVQVGASIDFIANGVVRAPKWMQRTGTEWIYRLLQEPKRLASRYWSNGSFFIRQAPLDVLFRRGG
jgi:N-acetylglucosaminyldiphosphoundecaprenol N-acetyl-beta-D-mannosaminyltransferase